jgi:Hg(II)-responsive transcriptional regulator
MEMFTIGQLARSAGVGVETVRYYERQGLLEQPSRRPSGYRQYSLDSAVRLRFIRAAKELGFSLREIQELLGLRGGSEMACCEVREIVKVKVAAIEEKIAALNRIKEALEDLLADCLAPPLPDGCPLLDALERRASH